MSKYKRLSNVDEVNFISVVQVKSIIGKGTSEDPVRQIIEYFDLDGYRLARTDTGEHLKTVEWIEGD